MTVDELKALLAQTPDDLLIVLAPSRESEQASPLYQCRQMLYVPHGRWQGHLFGLHEAEALGGQAVPGVGFAAGLLRTGDG